MALQQHSGFKCLGIIDLNGNWISGDGDSEGIYIDTNGNVGIGENSPDYRLHVYDSSATGAFIKLENSEGYATLEADAGWLRIAIDGTEHLFISPAGTKFNSTALPNADSTHNLGANGVRWATLYVDDIVCTNGSTMGSDVTITGDLSIQQGSSADTANVGGVIYSSGTTSTVGATTSETDMMSFSMAADTLDDNGDFIEVEMSGYQDADVDENVAVKIYVGSTVVTTITVSNGKSSYWHVRFTIMKQGASDQYVVGTKSASSDTDIVYDFQDDTAEDETAAMTIKATGTKSLAGDTCNQQMMTVKWYPVNT